MITRSVGARMRCVTVTIAAASIAPPFVQTAWNKRVACGVYNRGSPRSITDWRKNPAIRQNRCNHLRPSPQRSKSIKGGNMIKLLCCIVLLGASVMAADKNVYEFTLNSIDGQAAPLAAYKGKVVMLVNVASRCGFTPQYSALETIYEKYKDRGFVIIGIPANNFGAQEPGSNQEIKTFCSTKYHVTFPMMSKVSVKGEDITPLYQFLTDKGLNPQTGGEIQWNFTTFLIGPHGNVIARFAPEVTRD